VVKSCIFANNTGSYDVVGPDIYGTVQSADFNLVEDLSGATLVSGIEDHSIIGEDPDLGGLLDNGGGAWTHALQAGSPAIDAGSCTDVAGATIEEDQRGLERPQGSRCDIGAYEYAQPGLVLDKSVDDLTPEPGQRITYTVVVENSGAADATGGMISDTLPSGLSLAGPITLEPPTAGVVGVPPMLATDLTIRARERVTVTLPVTVSGSLPTPTRITNVATVVSEQVPVPELGSRTIVVTVDLRPSVYLPLVARAFQ
jgi:uncharacterized repeat protein (TIGR01451 family)